MYGFDTTSNRLMAAASNKQCNQFVSKHILDHGISAKWKTFNNCSAQSHSFVTIIRRILMLQETDRLTEMSVS
jgi:hypothetical protein